MKPKQTLRTHAFSRYKNYIAFSLVNQKFTSAVNRFLNFNTVCKLSEYYADYVTRKKI